MNGIDNWWVTPKRQVGDIPQNISTDIKISFFKECVDGWKLDIADYLINGVKNSMGKARARKIAETNEVVEAANNRLNSKKSLTDKKVIVTAGSTIEHPESGRANPNRSSGKMGVAAVEEALERGAKVTLIYGSGTADPPSGAKVIRVESTKEMFDAVVSELKSERCDILVATAVADIWAPHKPSNHEASTHTTQVPEIRLRDPLIVDVVKKSSPETFLVAFRAERGLSDDELIESAYKRLKAANADLVAINDAGREGAGFGVDTNEVFIVDPARNVTHIPLASKREVARRLLDMIEKKLHE